MALDERSCFTTTKDKEHGLQFDFSLDREKQSCFTEISVPPFYQGWEGVVHGGITATLLDEAMAFACDAAGYPDVVTMNLSVKYIKPVPAGVKLELTGEVVELKNRVIRTKSQLTHKGELLASCSGSMYVIDSAWKEKQK